MPEVLAIVIVFIVSVVIYAACWMHTRNPENFDSHAEAARAKVRHAWLRQRLEVARRENWGGEMVAVLALELEQVEAAMARNGEALMRNQGEI